MNKTVKNIIRYLLPAAIVVIAAGCSTTKRIADGEMLYTGVHKIHIESVRGGKVPSSVESDVKDPLNVKPNNPLYSPYIRTPFPMGLWAWNSLATDRTTGFKAWLYRNLAKEPVLISAVQPELRVGMVTDILDNLGYFGSSASYEVLQKKNPKKARLDYSITVAEPWVYSSVEYPAIRGPVTTIIDSLKSSSQIVAGAQYNVDTLNNERVRITNYLRNHSYYYFRPTYLEYLADTTRQRLKVDLRMVLAQGGVPRVALQPYNIGKVQVRLRNSLGGEQDTTYYNGIEIVYDKPLKLRPKILGRALSVVPGRPSRVNSINSTLNNLTKLGVFRYVNMEVTPLDSLREGDTALDMTIDAAFDQPLDADFEVDFSTKSSSFIGPGAVFGVRHKNFLRGGEVFSVRLNGNYEWQTGNARKEANATAVNSYEFGLNTSLAFPRTLGPKFIPRPRRFDARTTFNLGGTILNRPQFFTMISFNFSTTWDFQTSRRSRHSVSLFKLGYNHLLRTTEDFDDMMAENPAVALSFNDQFIPSASYTYTNERTMRGRRDRLIWQSTFITAGNILSGAWGIFSDKKPKRLFGTQFAQFIKGTTELKYYYATGPHTTLAFRVGLGVGYAYGNSEVLPYSEQFYVGGANSVRAFTVRSIGPGSYSPGDASVQRERKYRYLDQVGDIKFEANVEFRFRILGDLNGAVFLDSGGIWLMKKDPNRPGGEFKPGRFFEQLATGTGAGLRYDLSFLVVRADLGIGIHTPYKNAGKSGYYNISSFKDGLGFHLAIGYPF